MASLWGYSGHEDTDQLGQKLLSTTLELEKLKSETIEEMQKNNYVVNQLNLVLKRAIQQRDEARNQLEKLINKTTFTHFQPNSSTPPIESLSSPDFFHQESNNFNPMINQGPLIHQPSNFSPTNFSPTINHVSSPDFFHQESNNFNPMINQGPLIHQESNFSPKIDQESLIMDSLTKGKVLPQNGMFMQAVRQSAPLLQTLMVAGSLPRWKNPPPPQPPFQMPAVPIRGCDGRNNGSLMSSGVSNNDGFQLGKRQRFC